jgi:hypothetical protein
MDQDLSRAISNPALRASAAVAVGEEREQGLKLLLIPGGLSYAENGASDGGSDKSRMITPSIPTSGSRCWHIEYFGSSHGASVKAALRFSPSAFLCAISRACCSVCARTTKPCTLSARPHQGSSCSGRSSLGRNSHSFILTLTAVSGPNSSSRARIEVGRAGQQDAYETG